MFVLAITMCVYVIINMNNLMLFIENSEEITFKIFVILTVVMVLNILVITRIKNKGVFIQE